MLKIESQWNYLTLKEQKNVHLSRLFLRTGKEEKLHNSLHEASITLALKSDNDSYQLKTNALYANKVRGKLNLATC